jgi:uncharacterized protein
VPTAQAAEVMQVGIGLRQPHYEAFLAQRPPLGFVEVHSENFFADGGAALGVLAAVREHYPVSLHGVGLSLGAAAGLDPWHLERLACLAQRVEPVRISDHAAFARAPAVPGGPVLHANDLLPIAFTPASLDVMVRNVGQVQERLGRAILVENLSAYLGYDDAGQWPEAEFLVALCRRSGCGLLLDVNNLMVNALNAQASDPVAACCAFVDALPAQVVGEIHLAGHCDESDFGLVIDDHGSRVRDAVWQVYAHALRRLGARPTLVEWDTDLPALDVLLGEADTAAQWQARVCGS